MESSLELDSRHSKQMVLEDTLLSGNQTSMKMFKHGINTFLSNFIAFFFFFQRVMKKFVVVVVVVVVRVSIVVVVVVRVSF